MSNPVTRAITRALRSRQLRAFVEHCDQLEALVLAVYRAKAASSADHVRYAEIKRWFDTYYGMLAPQLEAHWRASRIGQAAVEHDPFRMLTSHADAAAFVDNWHALQTLPAAREALNTFLLQEQSQ
jgi:hypothetical protein